MARSLVWYGGQGILQTDLMVMLNDGQLSIFPAVNRSIAITILVHQTDVLKDRNSVLVNVWLYALCWSTEQRTT